MSKRTWNKKYTKKKSSSEIIDEKITALDKELEKLGVLSEKMTTANMYTTYEYDSGTPAVDPIPEVPPTYEDVTGGLGGDGGDFSWPDQGDGSDSEAATVIPDNLYTTYNDEQVPALRAIDTYNGELVDYGDHPSLGGLAFRGGWLGWNYLAYPSGSGIRGVGTTRFPGEGVGQAIYSAYSRWPYEGKVVKTVYQWQQLDCLFGSCQGASQYYPSDRSATSTPKADRALYAWTIWLPADADGNLLKNRILTDPGSPAVPGVPAVPPKPVVLDRFGLGDPDYYIGFIQNALIAALDIGKMALDYLFNKTYGNIIPAARATLISALSNYPEDAPYASAARTLGRYANGDDLIEQPLTDEEVRNLIRRAKAEAELSDTLLTPTLVIQNAVGQNTDAHYVLGGGSKVTVGFDGGVTIEDNYGFDTGGANKLAGKLDLPPVFDYAAGPATAATVPLGLALFGPGGSPRRAKLVQKIPISVVEEENPDLAKKLKRYATDNSADQLPITESWQSPKHTDIEDDERKRWFNPSDVAPEYPTKEPNTGIYTPSGKSVDSKEKREPYIKLTQKDLLRNHRLKDSEVKEMMDTINALNAFLDAHPEELIHARKRYPKDDVRLAELNWKMDQMLGASEEYLDGRFPENTRLFNKLQKSIKRNIELTDPKTFKNVKSPVTVNQLFTVDYISKEGIPILKKKAKSKNKKSPTRFLKKPRLKTKSEMVQEKLSKFQDDLKKFGIDA